MLGMSRADGRSGNPVATPQQDPAAPVAVRGQGRDQGNAQLLGPDRKETSPPWSVTQTRWGCAGVQACGVVTDRNWSKAAGRKPLGGTPAVGAGAQLRLWQP